MSIEVWGWLRRGRNHGRNHAWNRKAQPCATMAQPCHEDLSATAQLSAYRAEIAVARPKTPRGRALWGALQASAGFLDGELE
jgi:hypothetical protein